MPLFGTPQKEYSNAQKVTSENIMRSHTTMEFVRVDKNPAIGEIRADLPIGRGWNRDGSVIEWVNLGWTPAVEYDAKKNSEQAALKREAAKAEADEAQNKPESLQKGKK